MKSRFLFVLNIILFFISLVAAMWFLGANILVSIDDFSLFFKNFPRYFEFFAFNVLIPGFISLLFTSFFGLNILKFKRDNDYSRKRKFKIFLPIMGAIITIIGALILFIFLTLSRAEGLAFLSIYVFLLGGFLLTIILGILGFGCASCGPLILTSIFGFSATIGFLSILPFNGLRFFYKG